MGYMISRATPLFFPQDWRVYEHELALDYMQKFATEDSIRMQITGESATPAVTLIDCVSGAETAITGTSKALNASTYVHLFDIVAHKEGCYQVEVEGRRSAPFEVTSNEIELANTKVLRYTNASNNNALNTIFVLGDEQIWFEFRVECGWKSNGLQPKLDAESFRDQNQRLHYLYQHTYLVETLTFGQASGLPACYVDMINRIFCCDSISLGDTGLVRSDGATPQVQQLIEDGQKYVITLDVERTGQDDEPEEEPEEKYTSIASVRSGGAWTIPVEIGDYNGLMLELNVANPTAVPSGERVGLIYCYDSQGVCVTQIAVNTSNQLQGYYMTNGGVKRRVYTTSSVRPYSVLKAVVILNPSGSGNGMAVSGDGTSLAMNEDTTSNNMSTGKVASMTLNIDARNGVEYKSIKFSTLIPSSQNPVMPIALVPVKRTRDGKVGFYDQESERYYIDETGTWSEG